MRVLHVAPSFYPAVCYGGPIFSTLHLCLNLSKLGCQVTVLTTDANGETCLTAEQKEAPILKDLRVIYCPRLGRGTVAPQMLSELYTEAASSEIVHLTAVYNFSTFPTLLAARHFGKPLVWSPRGALQRWRGSRRVLLKQLWEKVCKNLMPQRTAWHFTSPAEDQESTALLECKLKATIPNGVELPALPERLPGGMNLQALYIGRLDPKKGIENLLVAIQIVRSAGIDCHLNIVGGGQPAYAEALKSMAVKIGVAAHVNFMGQLDGRSKFDAFACSDVVVVPSYTENFGTVIAEALAHARPVIVSRNTPWRDVETHDCGLWIDNAPGSLARALLDISKRDLPLMGRRGREWMERDFTWLQQAKRMHAFYEALLQTN